MKKNYYYLAYRIFTFYTDTLKEKNLPGMYTSGILSILAVVNLISIYYLLVLFDIVSQPLNEYHAITLFVILFFTNYFFVAKPKKLIGYNFTKSENGGYIISLVIGLTIVFYLIVAIIHRDRVLV